MRINTLMLAVATAVLTSYPTNAQTPSSKVAVINLQGAIVGTHEGQNASKELDAKVEPKQKEFAQRQTEIAQLEDQLNKGAAVLSEDKRNQLARDIEQRKKKLERDITDAQENLNAEQQRLLESLGQKMMVLIGKYAKDNGVSLVLDDSNPSTPVLYASTAIDITQDLITLYDKAPVSPAKKP